MLHVTEDAYLSTMLPATSCCHTYLPQHNVASHLLLPRLPTSAQCCRPPLVATPTYLSTMLPATSCCHTYLPTSAQCCQPPLAATPTYLSTMLPATSCCHTSSAALYKAWNNNEALYIPLTDLPLVLHISVSESGQHWLR